jgi:hypothetical protein
VPISHGLLEKVEAGSQGDIAERLALAISRKWNQEVIAEMILTFLFLGVAMLGLILYMAQRHHSEYLWLALMCFSVTVMGAVELAHWLALISSSTFDLLSLDRPHLHGCHLSSSCFAGTERRHYVRYFQGFVLIFPLLSILGLQQTYQVLSISAEIAFCVFVCALLLRSWRKGFREAGILLVPFFLAATADSIDTVLDYMAGRHWISEGMAFHKFHLGPIEISLGVITYGVFLSSLIASFSPLRPRPAG